MYLGYMKKGLQTLAMFAISGFLAYFFADANIDLIAIAFVILIPVIWLYQMFDSMHTLSRMRRLEIEVPEDDGFYIPENFKPLSLFQNRTVAKVLAAVLLILGISGIAAGVLNNLHYFLDWQTVHDITRMVNNNLVPVIVSLVLIVIGIRLLAGGKSKPNTDVNSINDGGKED